MENNSETKYSLKGQNDILLDNKIVSMFEEYGIEVFTDNTRSAVHRRPFSLLLHMYESKDEKEKQARAGLEKKNKRLKTSIFVLVVSCSILSILCLNLHTQSKDLLAEQLILEADIKATREGMSSVENNLRDKALELRRLKADYDELLEECDFWRDAAVIVTTTGSKYHTYDCYHTDGRRYYIYNIELAKAKGYTACLDCIE